MTEKNAVKSETVSPLCGSQHPLISARCGEPKGHKSSHIFVLYETGREERWANTESETVSPAREFHRQSVRSKMPSLTEQELDAQMKVVTTSYDLMEEYATYRSSLSSQAIGAAAKEAAVEVVQHLCGRVSHLYTIEAEAIILRAIEKARTK